MEESILNQTISNFYNVNNKYDYTKLKNIIAPVVCYVERNLNEVSYKKYGISSNFKENFSYISNRLEDEEIDKFIRLYKRIRALNVHARTFYSPQDMQNAFTFDMSKLTSDCDFLGLDIPITTTFGELTVYGMIYVLSIMLNKEQLRSLIALMCNERRFSLPSQYLTYKKKKSILDKYCDINNIRREERDNPIVFCAEQCVMPIISETFLIFEEEIYKTHDIKPKNSRYLSFPEAANVLDIDEDNKRQLIFIRNMWAHGNCFYYTSQQDNVIVKFIDIMKLLVNTEYSTIAQNALKKLRYKLLNLKYKRPAEMAIKLQKDRLEMTELIHRLNTMTNFVDKDELVPLYIEDMLSDFEGLVMFGYNNKEEKLGKYIFKHIEIIEHISGTNKPFIIDGIQTDLCYFKEFALPEYSRLNVLTKGDTIKNETVVASTRFVTKRSIIYGE